MGSRPCDFSPPSLEASQCEGSESWVDCARVEARLPHGSSVQWRFPLLLAVATGAGARINPKSCWAKPVGSRAAAFRVEAPRSLGMRGLEIQSGSVGVARRQTPPASVMRSGAGRARPILAAGLGAHSPATTPQPEAAVGPKATASAEAAIVRTRRD